MFVGKREIAIGDAKMNIAATIAHGEIPIDDIRADIFAFHSFDEDLAIIQVEARNLHSAGNDQNVIDAASPAHDRPFFLRQHAGGNGDSTAFSLHADSSVFELLLVHRFLRSLKPEICRIGTPNRNGTTQVADREPRRRIYLVNVLEHFHARALNLLAARSEGQKERCHGRGEPTIRHGDDARDNARACLSDFGRSAKGFRVGPKSNVGPLRPRLISRIETMKPIASPSAIHGQRFHAIAAALAIATFFLGSRSAPAQTPTPAPPSAPPSATVAPPAEAPKIPNDQLDSLVAPIALYPDPLLSQTLVASTYPLEIIQLQQWLGKNKSLKGKALSDAVMKETWDPSIQAMASFPDVVKLLAENIKWTDDLGNAFLAQQSDVMDAVQRMRAKADEKGALKTSKEQKVEKKTVDNKNVIVIEQADPEVVYVPSYNPSVVYGASPYYPYPPMYYPPYGGALLGFSAGIILGGAINGGWGWGCGWGNGDVNINNNNNYINHNNRQNINNRQNVSGGNKWQHNPQHRGGAPYSNKNLSNKYGGDRNRGPNSDRTSNADRNRPGGDRNQGPGGDRNRPSTKPSTADRNRPSNNKPSTNRPSTSDRSNANRPSSSNRPSGSTDRIGNQNVSRNSSPRSNSAFNSGGGYNRSSAMSSHSRGASSMSRSSGFSGGGSRGGGSRGGGRRR